MRSNNKDALISFASLCFIKTLPCTRNAIIIERSVALMIKAFLDVTEFHLMATCLKYTYTGTDHLIMSSCIFNQHFLFIKPS